MSQLSARDRDDLGNVSLGIETMHPELRDGTRKAAAAFADVLRQNAPDLDDVTLGRVLLHVGDYVSVIANGNLAMDQLSDTLLIAAVDMTALERGETPSL